MHQYWADSTQNCCVEGIDSPFCSIERAARWYSRAKQCLLLSYAFAQFCTPYAYCLGTKYTTNTILDIPVAASGVIIERLFQKCLLWSLALRLDDNYAL